jgi:DNA-binding HxlR family transcriptional regulator
VSEAPSHGGARLARARVAGAPAAAEPPAAGEPPAAAAGDPRLSPLAAALESVGDRWTLLLVEALLGGPRRFGDLQEEMGGIAPNVLSQRLRRLEGDGLVLAQPYSDRPQRYVYELSSSGHELAGALRLLADWGARHADSAEPPRHEACGTPVEVRWWCPTCERPVGDDEPADLHYA